MSEKLEIPCHYCNGEGEQYSAAVLKVLKCRACNGRGKIQTEIPAGLPFKQEAFLRAIYSQPVRIFGSKIPIAKIEMLENGNALVIFCARAKPDGRWRPLKPQEEPDAEA